MDETKPIGSGLAVALIAFCLFIDFIQFILAILLIGELLDSAIDIFAMAVVGLMLGQNGNKTLSRRAISYVGTGVLEFIPIANALPWWTIFAVYTVVMDRIRHRNRMEEPEQTRPRGGGSWRL